MFEIECEFSSNSDERIVMRNLIGSSFLLSIGTLVALYEKRTDTKYNLKSKY